MTLYLYMGVFGLVYSTVSLFVSLEFRRTADLGREIPYKQVCN